MEKINIRKLKNGLTVAFCHYPNFNSAHLNILIGVGSRNENKKLNGIAHLTEHLFYKKILDELKVGRWLKNYASEDFTAYTYLDRTEYDFSVHHLDFENIIKLVCQILVSSKINLSDIKKEKEVIKEEILEEQGDVDFKFKQFIKQKLYGSNSLSFDILGDSKSLAGITAHNVSRFISEFYQPENIIIGLSGKLNEQQIINSINKYFCFRPIPARLTNNYQPFSYRGDNIYFTDGRRDQAWFNWYFPWSVDSSMASYVKREFLIGILNQYLSSFFRDRGFCYVFNVESLVFKDYADVGIMASFNPNKIVEFYDELVKVLNRFKKALTQKDLVLAKNNKIKILELDSDYPKSTMNSLVWDNFIFNQTLSLVEQKRIISAISLSEVKALFDDLIKNKKGTIVIGGKLSSIQKEKIKHLYQFGKIQ